MLVGSIHRHNEVRTSNRPRDPRSAPPPAPLAQPWGYSLVWGVREGCRVAPWDVAGDGGGMLGGVARGCGFTSAGESDIPAAFSFLSAVGATPVRGGERESAVRQAQGHAARCQPHLASGSGGPGGSWVCPQRASLGQPFQRGWRVRLQELWGSEQAWGPHCGGGPGAAWAPLLQTRELGGSGSHAATASPGGCAQTDAASPPPLLIQEVWGWPETLHFCFIGVPTRRNCRPCEPPDAKRLIWGSSQERLGSRPFGGGRSLYFQHLLAQVTPGSNRPNTVDFCVA